jgi:hypothetical protein
LGDDSDDARQLAPPHRADVLSKDAHGPLPRCEEPRSDPQERGFSSAVRAKEGDDTTRLHAEAHAVDYDPLLPAPVRHPLLRVRFWSPERPQDNNDPLELKGRRRALGQESLFDRVFSHD